MDRTSLRETRKHTSAGLALKDQMHPNKLRKPSASKNVVLGLEQAQEIIHKAIETMNRNGVRDRSLTDASRQLRCAHDWIDRYTAWYWARKEESKEQETAQA